MDLKSLVGTKVNVLSKVKRISNNDYMVTDYILLEDVYIQGEYWRDHCYIKKSERLEGVSKDDLISFTATLYEYLDSEDVTNMKIGVKEIRSVKKVML